MPQVPVYNQAGKEAGTLELSKAVFGVRVKEALVTEVTLAQQANSRTAIAHTKMRGDVRGGGKKPWKQKGTGRARQGSIRSPQWRGGGVVFGPRSARNFSVKINKKTRQAVLRMVLSDKVVNKKLIVIDLLPQDGKTKTMAVVRRVLPGAGRKARVVLDTKDEPIIRAFANVPRTVTI
ncbi:MAG: 50S ribosomal protein L4, partial [Patescibacteria group bacterium]